MPDNLSQLDANQVIRRAGVNLDNDSSPSGGGLNVYSVGGTLVPEKHDQISLTYVAAGNGVGEIETAIFYLDTVEICTLTLTYDAQNRLIDVLRTEP